MSGEGLRIYREAVGTLIAPGSPFEITVAANGLPAFVDTPACLVDIYDRILAEHRDRTMLDYEGRRQSYGEMFEAAARFGAALRADYGIAPGDRVGIAMRNLPEWFIAFVGLGRIGAVAAVLNSRGAPDELVAAAARVGCKLILADDRCAERLAEAGDVPVLGITDLHTLAARTDADLTPVRGRHDDPALILFTSGTTGRPKGATITQGNLCHMSRLTQYLAEAGLAVSAKRTGMPIDQMRGLMPRPSIIMIMPLFHISGIVNFLMCSMSGGLMTMIRRWAPAVALDVIERNKVTAIAGPSLVMADLLAQPNAAERMQSISGMVIGGQASPVALSRQIRASLPRVAQSTGWGMTETTGAITSAPAIIFAEHPSTAGVALPLAQLRIVGDDGLALPSGEIGEIEVRSPLVMKGYWGDSDADALSFRDGWLCTGDLGYITEEGLLFIVDRAKDMVISAGENIYCAEVERVLGSVEHHLEVALFGMPDDRLGERAIAAVVVREDVPADADAVRALARAHLADYKVPAEVMFDLGPLPRNALGKVDKAALKKLYLERQTAADQMLAETR